MSYRVFNQHSYKAGDRVAHRYLRAFSRGTVLKDAPAGSRYVEVEWDHKRGKKLANEGNGSRHDHIRPLNLIERIGDLDAAG